MSHAGGLKAERCSQGQLSVRAASKYAASETGNGTDCSVTLPTANTAVETSFSKKRRVSASETEGEIVDAGILTQRLPHVMRSAETSAVATAGTLKL